MTRIAVIGGGIVGASAAFHLALAGVETVLIDNAAAGRATSAGAGIVAPGTSLHETPGSAELAVPAVRYYPELVANLMGLGVSEPGYEICGKLVVANTIEKAEQLPDNTALFRQRHEDGTPNIGEIEEVTPGVARELFPVLGDVLAAIYVPDAARVDGAKMRAALTEGARALGATVVPGSAELIVEGDRVTGVMIPGENHQFSVDAIVLAAGAWTNQLLAPIGHTLPVEPQKGQIIHIEMPEHDTTQWPILDWSASQYQLSFGPNRVVCGATREFHSGYDLRVTAGGVREILDEQIALCPGLAKGSIAEVRVGLRPYSADVSPFIGHLPGNENVVVCTGHGPSGLTLGPYSGRLAAELATGQKPSTSTDFYRLDRQVTSTIPPA